MKNTKITLEFNEEKLDALTLFIKEKGTTVEEELMDSLEKLYDKVVPQHVKTYLDSKIASTKEKPKKKNSFDIPKFPKHDEENS